MHQYQRVLKSSSCFHSSCAASAGLALPAPLFPAHVGVQLWLEVKSMEGLQQLFWLWITPYERHSGENIVPVNLFSKAGGTNTSKKTPRAGDIFSGNLSITAFGGVGAHPAAVEQVCGSYMGHLPWA